MILHYFMGHYDLRCTPVTQNEKWGMYRVCTSYLFLASFNFSNQMIDTVSNEIPETYRSKVYNGYRDMCFSHKLKGFIHPNQRANHSQ